MDKVQFLKVYLLFVMYSAAFPGVLPRSHELVPIGGCWNCRWRHGLLYHYTRPSMLLVLRTREHMCSPRPCAMVC